MRALMTRRSVAVVLLLSFVTCGLYSLYWLYVTTTELKTVTARADLNPGLELVLSIVTCGLWGLYAGYRNAGLVHQVFTQGGRPHEDKSTLVLILNLLMLVVGVTGFVATAILQDELNKLADSGLVPVLPG